MKKKVQMKKMAGVFLALAILGIWSFPDGKRVCGCKSGAGRRSGGCSS